MFYKCWEKIKNTESFEGAFEALEETGDQSRLIEVNRRYRELVRNI